MATRNEEILLEAGTNELEVIEFLIHGKEDGCLVSSFGVNVAKVLEIMEAPPGLHPSPGATHPSFLGTIPLREHILPIIDLSVWLEIDRTPAKHELIIVTEFNQTVTGFLVSDVTQIYRVAWTDVYPPSQIVSSQPTNCITGTIHFDDHTVLMIDFEKIISELDKTFEGPQTFSQQQASQRYHAMIVDDSGTIRNVIEDRFAQANFAVTTFKNGRDALNALLDIKEASYSGGVAVTDAVNIIIADIEMPSMDGYTLTKNIKTDEDLQHIPVILFSSLISVANRRKGESVMADDQITKPEFPTLVERSLALIEKFKQKREHPLSA
ncbi:chemotaxis protein [Desulfovibrio inopinatus]|uniref:chemotaxis protein n=1 Tax=Desulfovibrio inopinatus TaxID=102109 RepID=UPI000416AE98|nr:chemotaxis protein [Desulfovibrio inopinatus]